MPEPIWMFCKKRESLAPARNQTPDWNMAVYTILHALTLWNTNLWNTGHTCGTCFFPPPLICLFLSSPLPPWHNSPQWATPSSSSRLHNHTHTHHTQ